MFHEFFHIPEDTSGHVGTAGNVAGLYVVDVVEFPEWCSGPGRVAKVEVVGSNPISRSKILSTLAALEEIHGVYGRADVVL